jgi:hypothetical protein
MEPRSCAVATGSRSVARQGILDASCRYSGAWSASAIGLFALPLHSVYMLSNCTFIYILRSDGVYRMMTEYDTAGSRGMFELVPECGWTFRLRGFDSQRSRPFSRFSHSCRLSPHVNHHVRRLASCSPVERKEVLCLRGSPSSQVRPGRPSTLCASVIDLGRRCRRTHCSSTDFSKRPHI